jgi:glycosyltransferase involved in cell wall biosynthesis
MLRRTIRILTNIGGLNQSFLPDAPLAFSYVGWNDAWGERIRFIAKCLRSDLIILDTAVEKLMLACAVKWVVPMLRFRIVSVDLILRTPTSRTGRVKAFFKRFLLKQVHRFILFFKDLRGCERFYGIDPDRAIYVRFKVNGWEEIQHRQTPTEDGDYVLCAGRTLRDIKTFVEAMRQAGCPGVLLQQRRELLAAHGTSAWSGELPSNLRLTLDESDELEAYLDFVAKARLVVIPRFKSDIAPTGISTYLVAMALNRCVIISEGPGASDVLTHEAVVVPAEDAEKLAEQIRLLWDDTTLRTSVALRGREYAGLARGKERLHRDILRSSIQSLSEDN